MKDINLDFIPKECVNSSSAQEFKDDNKFDISKVRNGKGIVFIGEYSGFGLELLKRAMKKSNIEVCEEFVTLNDETKGQQELLEKISKEFESLDELNEIIADERLLDKPNHKKKSKQVKNWERTKFYQR